MRTLVAGDGGTVRITDAALTQIVVRAAESGGPDAIGMFSCSKATNEVNFVAQKFMRVAIGTNNIDSCNRT